MKTKCPHCFGEKDCDKCVDGYVEVTFVYGMVSTRHCKSCGEDNGGTIRSEIPNEGPGLCVFCGSLDTVWVEVGHTEELGMMEPKGDTP